MGRIKDTKLRSSSESVSVQDHNDYGLAYLFHAEQLSCSHCTQYSIWIDFYCLDLDPHSALEYMHEAHNYYWHIEYS